MRIGRMVVVPAALILASVFTLPQSAEAAAKGNKFNVNMTASNGFTGTFNVSYKTNGVASWLRSDGANFDFNYTELDLGVISFVNDNRNYGANTESHKGLSLLSFIVTGSYSNTEGVTGSYFGFKNGTAVRESGDSAPDSASGSSTGE